MLPTAMTNTNVIANVNVIANANAAFFWEEPKTGFAASLPSQSTTTKRIQKLQDLQDERLQQCQEEPVETWVQCFYYGISSSSSLDSTTDTITSSSSSDDNTFATKQQEGMRTSQSTSKTKGGIPMW